MIEIRDDQRELLLGLLVEVRNGDTGSKDGVVGVRDGHVCRSFGSLFNIPLAYDPAPFTTPKTHTKLSSSTVLTPW